MVSSAVQIWRNWEVDGVPSSGNHDPELAEVRAWGAWIEGVVAAFTANGGLVYASKAAMNADLLHGANTSAWVITDATTANNGVYAKVGTSGVGSWTRLADLPYSFIVGADAGAGTANAIQSTTSMPVSGSALVVTNVFRVNTGSPVTISFNGGTPVTIKTSAGADVAVGGLPAGMVMFGYLSGTTFRLLSEQAGTAFLAQLQAMLDAATALATPGDGTVSIPKLHASVINRLIEFDIRDSRFAGGAKFDDSTDDTPAFAAAIAYFQTLGGLNQYSGKNGAKVRLPRGVSRVSNLDVTLASNVHFVGEGDNCTTLRNVNNNPCIFSTNVAGVNDGYRIGFEGFTVYGPGWTNGNAHGIKLGSINNGVIKDIRMYACRNALDVYNNWQTDVTRLKVDGGTDLASSLTCYNGIYMRDGPGSVGENAVKFTGGVISGVQNYGFRGESISGSVVIGMEFLACGVLAMYLGDNPSGKDVKWFTVSACLFDTTPDLIKINKGGAAYCGQMHFSGCWDGYASEGGGNGVAMELNSVSDSSFRMDTLFNSDIGVVANGCNNINWDVGVMQTYDRSNVGAVPVQLNNTGNSTFRVGGMLKNPGSPGTLAASEIGASDWNTIDLPHNDGGVTIVGANTSVRLGTKSKRSTNRGSANILVATTSIVVNHGLFRAPVDGEVMLTQKFNQTAVGVSDVWVDPASFTATQFTIRSNAAPSSTLGVYWTADVSRG